MTIAGSPVLELEIDKFSDDEKRKKVLALYSLASITIPCTEKIKQRSEILRIMANIKVMDCLHVATAKIVEDNQNN